MVSIPPTPPPAPKQPRPKPHKGIRMSSYRLQLVESQQGYGRLIFYARRYGPTTSTEQEYLAIHWKRSIWPRTRHSMPLLMIFMILPVGHLSVEERRATLPLWPILLPIEKIVGQEGTTKMCSYYPSMWIMTVFHHSWPNPHCHLKLVFLFFSSPGGIDWSHGRRPGGGELYRSYRGVLRMGLLDGNQGTSGTLGT